jgi:tetratricopeptide (TPR) repeat protein
MWLSQPLFGIGVDRYGAYFREFRDPSYPLTYGFDISSTNAHNTFIQFFATSGFFVGFVYILLNLYVLQRAIIGIRASSGNKKVYLTGLLSAWIAFQAQSLVSIDNIGISIWGWILGGAIVGLSVSQSDGLDKVYLPSKSSIRSPKLIQSLVSSALTLPTLVLVITLYNSESNSYKSSIQVNLQDVQARDFYKELQVKTINSPLIDSTYKIYAASNLIESGFVNEGLVALENESSRDPRKIEALNVLAFVYEQLGDLPKSITYREKIAQLDPWGAKNYLALGKSYQQLGNSEKSQEILKKILSFASNTSIAEQAAQELQP